MKIALFCLLTILSLSVPGSEIYFRSMPPGWGVTKIYNSTKEVRRQVGRRLGVPLKELSNNYLNINGKSIMINILEAHNEASARVLYAKISSMKGDRAFCLSKGTTVIEFSGSQVTVPIAQKVAWELGFTSKPQEVKYKLDFKLATVKKSHYMSFNRLSNLLASPETDGIPKVGRYSRRFVFWDKCYLRYAPKTNIYKFKPKAINSITRNGIIRYAFTSLPEKYNIPYVNVDASIKLDNSGFTKAPEIDVKTYTASTSFWPSDDPKIKDIANKLVSGLNDNDQKVKVLLRAAYLPRRGPIRGTRYGVKKVIEQQFGNCWDSSDLFVTLCRAANIPCRQVAGWIYGLSGHVWAEYWINGKGWQQVDPSSGGKVKCGIYFIPYFSTDNGRMPILYVEFPKIEVVK